jgi:hypothetical protein
MELNEFSSQSIERHGKESNAFARWVTHIDLEKSTELWLCCRIEEIEEIGLLTGPAMMEKSILN